MASFSAELRVEGYIIPILRCHFSTQQGTNPRGQAATKVRSGRVECEADIPEHEFLAAWASLPHKRCAADLVFLSADGGQALETLRLSAAYCVDYAETFVAGDLGMGAYRCSFTLSNPEGWVLTPGGPSAPFVAPAARTHGSPVALFETPDPDPAVAPGELAAASRGALPAALAAMLGTSLLIQRASGDEGVDRFEEAVKADLQLIYATPTGRRLLDSLHASGKQTTIDYAFSGGNRANIPKSKEEREKCYFQEDGVTPGQGHGLTIDYNPATEAVGPEPWAKRPPAIGLAHELIHAEQAAHGRMRRGTAPNPGRFTKDDPPKPAETLKLELEAVGLPPYDEYHVSENQLRREWTPPQIRRAMY